MEVYALKTYIWSRSVVLQRSRAFKRSIDSPDSVHSLVHTEVQNWNAYSDFLLSLFRFWLSRLSKAAPLTNRRVFYRSSLRTRLTLGQQQRTWIPGCSVNTWILTSLVEGLGSWWFWSFAIKCNSGGCLEYPGTADQKEETRQVYNIDCAADIHQRNEKDFVIYFAQLFPYK